MNSNAPLDLSRSRDMNEKDKEIQEIKKVLNNHVALSFSKFVKLMGTHDISGIVEEEDKRKDYVVVEANLLTDISNCEKNVSEEKTTSSVFTGVLLYGVVLGIILSLIIALVMGVVGQPPMSPRALFVILLGFIGVALFPLVVILSDPYLQSFQDKNREFFERLIRFFGKE